MSNEPVAWMSEFGQFIGKVQDEICHIPLYTHPAKTEDEGKVCARCGAIAYDSVITQTAKTLTDKEILDVTRHYGIWFGEDTLNCIRAILRKAQENV